MQFKIGRAVLDFFFFLLWTYWIKYTVEVSPFSVCALLLLKPPCSAYYTWKAGKEVMMTPHQVMCLYLKRARLSRFFPGYRQLSRIEDLFVKTHANLKRDKGRSWGNSWGI